MIRMEKKAILPAKMLVVFILCIIVIFVIARPLSKIAFGTKTFFDGLGPSKCTDAEKQRSIMDFKQTIQRYGQRQREGGGPNELYAPEDALKHFKKYLACKKEGMFSLADVETYNLEIINLGKAVYVLLAEDVCKVIDLSRDDDERRDQKEKYAVLVDDYYETFEALGEEDVEFQTPSNC